VKNILDAIGMRSSPRSWTPITRDATRPDWAGSPSRIASTAP
jgi:hypothetical protein